LHGNVAKLELAKTNISPFGVAKRHANILFMALYAATNMNGVNHGKVD
jgi:hypothetical protein